MNYYITFILFYILFGNVFGNFPKNSRKTYSTKMIKFYKKPIEKQRKLQYTNINNKFFNSNKKNNSFKNDNNSSIGSYIPEKIELDGTVNDNIYQNGNKTETHVLNYISNRNRHSSSSKFSTGAIIGLVVAGVVLVVGSIILALILRKYQNKTAEEDNAKTVVKLKVDENLNKIKNNQA